MNGGKSTAWRLTRRRVGTTTLLATSSLGVTGCLGQLTGEEVTIGGSLPLSGNLKAIGVPLKRGLRLWADAVNEQGGLAGREVRLDIVDDGGDPETAREASRSLVERADLLVAPYGSAATRAVLPVVESAGVPCVAPTAGNRSLWEQGREWTTQLLNPVDTFLRGVVTAAFRHGAGSVAFVHREGGFTAATMRGAADHARRLGGEVQARTVYSSASERAEKLERALAGDPDLLVGGGFQPGAPGGGFLPDAVALARADRRASGDAKLTCWSIGASYPAFRERVGEHAAFATGVTGWKPYVPYPGVESFVDRYRGRWGSAPDAHAAQGYAAGQVLQAAVERAGSVTSVAVRDALFALETTTVFGAYRVDARGLQVGKENAVVQWQEGEPTVVWPERWKEADLVYPDPR